MKKYIDIAGLVLLVALISACATGTGGERYTHSSRMLTIKGVRDIPQSEYNDYRRFVADGNAYVIVHPAYYLFVHNRKNPSGDPVVEDFMMQQIRAEREFISHAARDRHLTVIVMPGMWHSRLYIDYLNGITGGSESVLYVNSASRNSGDLASQDIDRLRALFDAAGVENIIIGGGYIGRCQSQVYRKLSQVFGYEKVAIAPEISSFSPSDISVATIRMFMAEGNRINPRVVTAYIKNNRMKKISRHTNIRNISPLE